MGSDRLYFASFLSIAEYIKERDLIKVILTGWFRGVICGFRPTIKLSL